MHKVAGRVSQARAGVLWWARPAGTGADEWLDMIAVAGIVASVLVTASQTGRTTEKMMECPTGRMSERKWGPGECRKSCYCPSTNWCPMPRCPYSPVAAVALDVNYRRT